MWHIRFVREYDWRWRRNYTRSPIRWFRTRISVKQGRQLAQSAYHNCVDNTNPITKLNFQSNHVRSLPHRLDLTAIGANHIQLDCANRLIFKSRICRFFFSSHYSIETLCTTGAHVNYAWNTRIWKNTVHVWNHIRNHWPTIVIHRCNYLRPGAHNTAARMTISYNSP